jgi:hypothetical protein
MARRVAELNEVSAAFTGFAFVLIPLPRPGDKRQGQPVGPIVVETATPAKLIEIKATSTQRAE